MSVADTPKSMVEQILCAPREERTRLLRDNIEDLSSADLVKISDSLIDDISGSMLGSEAVAPTMTATEIETAASSDIFFQTSSRLQDEWDLLDQESAAMTAEPTITSSAAEDEDQSLLLLEEAWRIEEPEEAAVMNLPVIYQERAVEMRRVSDSEYEVDEASMAEPISKLEILKQVAPLHGEYRETKAPKSKETLGWFHKAVLQVPLLAGLIGGWSASMLVAGSSTPGLPVIIGFLAAVNVSLILSVLFGAKKVEQMLGASVVYLATSIPMLPASDWKPVNIGGVSASPSMLMLAVAVSLMGILLVVSRTDELD